MDLWPKIKRAVKKGARTARNFLFLIPAALVYPTKNPFGSFNAIKHDSRVSLEQAIDMGAPEKERKYDPPVETTQASKNLGIEIVSYKDKKIKFLASRTLTGDIPYLAPEQLDAVGQFFPNIEVFKEENKVVIEVDIGKITNTIKKCSEQKGKCMKEIKDLIIEEICHKVERSLRGLAEVAGAEFVRHIDQKLLRGIAVKLYLEYDRQVRSSEVIKEFNMTNPRQFPFCKETLLPVKRQLLKNTEDEINECGSGLPNPEILSSKVIKTPSVSPRDEGRWKC